jgi:RNase H-like domain found in reverse transcriptase
VQLNWSTIQTEAYAIFVCCTQLAYLIRDRPFSIQTDHKNLTFMTKNSNSMVTRWYVALQDFDYTLHFVKGSQNTIADVATLSQPYRTGPAFTSTDRPRRWYVARGPSRSTITVG